MCIRLTVAAKLREASYLPHMTMALRVAHVFCAIHPRPIKDVALEMTELSAEELERLLDPLELTKGGFKG